MRPPRGLTLAQRIDRLSQAAPGGCIEWTGSTDGRMGYGKIRIGDRMRYAHRAAYELRHGPIPDGQVVRHRCDNPPCVNVDHLELGTQADNVRDTHDPGRASRRDGAYSNSARLTAADVASIRRRRSQGALLRELASQFGVSESQIHNITANKQWKESA